jgi:hypothetical protein
MMNGMPATIQLEHLQGDGTKVVPVTFVRFRSDDSSNIDSGGLVTLPPDVSAAFSVEITGGTSPQTITIRTVAGIVLLGDYLLVEPGTLRQEVALVTDTSGADQITAIIRRSHPAGSLLVKIAAAYSKVFRLNALTKPDGGISNVRFNRLIPLPFGLYDQFRILTDYASGSSTPWPSTGNALYTSVPPDPTLIYGGPQLTKGPIPNLVEIQWLTTARAIPADITEQSQIDALKQVIPSGYRFAWDEF